MLGMSLLAAQLGAAATELKELKSAKLATTKIRLLEKTKPSEKVKLPKMLFDSSTPLGLPSTTGWLQYKEKKLKSWAGLVQPGYDDYLDQNLKSKEYPPKPLEEGK